jgi:hypothetical protein
VVPGLAAISALTCIGLFLSLWALRERSIIGVCGVHGGFNASILVLGMIGAVAADPTVTPGGALIETFQAATTQSGDASAAGAVLQLAVFAGLSALVWLRLRRGPQP